MAPRRRRSPVVVDLQALQSQGTRDRGIGTYALNWASAIERLDASLVRAYILDPDLAPPSRTGELLKSNKLAYRDAIDLSGVELWHTLSPFDLHLRTASCSLPRIGGAGVRHSATVYDLIPALDPDRELADPVDRRRYRTRLEVVRFADALFTLSSSVADDLVNLAGVEPSRVHVVGAAPDARFSPPGDRDDSRMRSITELSRLGLRGRYVLAASGSHPRKNNEAVVRAFAALPPEVANGLQLVITGEVDESTAHHYRHLARQAGRDDAVVVAGFVDDDLLVALTQGADLAIVAALAEGYGLPIAEAHACGTPVIASDRPPFDEVVRAEGRFDPTDDVEISAALARVLVDRTLKARLVEPRPPTWSEVATRSIEAFESALERAPRRAQLSRALHRRRPRLAFVTPLPPAPTGVAGYSYQLVRALLGTEKVTIDVFCEENPAGALVPEGARLHPVSAFSHIELLEGPFDHVLYTIGNSHHHLGAHELLMRRNGVVLAHDVRLTNLYRHVHGDPSMLPGGFERALTAMYPGRVPPGVGRDGEVSSADVERYGLVMAREVISHATRYLVNSDFAASLARLDAVPGQGDVISTLPFAIASKGKETPGFVEDDREVPAFLDGDLGRCWGAATPPEGTVIAHFGIVDPVKRPELIMRAHARLLETGTRATLAFVGPIGDELCAALAELAVTLKTAASVLFTGPLPPHAYREWMRRSQLAVQLRAESNGEASAAVGECLSMGLATIVSDLGWTGELPDGVAVKVSTEIDAAGLSAAMKRLVRDAPLRRAVGDLARDYAGERTFDRTARVLLEVLASVPRQDQATLRGEAASSAHRASFR